MQEDVLNDIRACVESIDLPFVTHVLIGGSAVRPFIDRPGDVDVLAFVRDDCPGGRLSYARPLREALAGIRGARVNLVTASASEPYRKKDMRPNAFSINRKTLICLKGDIDELFPEGDFDVLHEDRAAYVECLKRFMASARLRRQIERFGRVKCVYEALAGAYFLRNGACELTEKQRRDVNILHDCADGWEELYGRIGEELRFL